MEGTNTECVQLYNHRALLNFSRRRRWIIVSFNICLNMAFTIGAFGLDVHPFGGGFRYRLPPQTG
jgi:hypothetical protein